VLEAAKRAFGAVATEYGPLPASSRPITSVARRSEGRFLLAIKSLMDHMVPMWDLTIQGLIFSEQTGLAWENAMRAVLFGKHIRDEWTVRTAIRHPALDDARIAKEVALYDLCLKQFGRLQTEFITAYSEPAPTSSARPSRTAPRSLPISVRANWSSTAKGSSGPRHWLPDGSIPATMPGEVPPGLLYGGHYAARCQPVRFTNHACRAANAGEVPPSRKLRRDKTPGLLGSDGGHVFAHFRH